MKTKLQLDEDVDIILQQAATLINDKIFEKYPHLFYNFNEIYEVIYNNITSLRPILLDELRPYIEKDNEKHI